MTAGGTESFPQLIKLSAVHFAPTVMEETSLGFIASHPQHPTKSGPQWLKFGKSWQILRILSILQVLTIFGFRRKQIFGYHRKQFFGCHRKQTKK